MSYKEWLIKVFKTAIQDLNYMAVSPVYGDRGTLHKNTKVNQEPDVQSRTLIMNVKTAQLGVSLRIKEVLIKISISVTN